VEEPSPRHRTKSDKWRATADEDGHYSFAVALWGFGKPFQDGEDAWGTHWRLDATVRRQGKKCCGKNNLDRANWRKRAEVRHLLGAVMKAKKARNKRPSVLDVVSLLTDLPAQRLARGQVGTVVEQLDDKTLLVEFGDDQGRAYAIAPCPRADLLILHYVPEAA